MAALYPFLSTFLSSPHFQICTHQPGNQIHQRAKRKSPGFRGHSPAGREQRRCWLFSEQ